MSLLGDSVNLLHGALRNAAGIQVTYRRGNQPIEKLVVVPGRTRHDGYGEGEFELTGREADWIVLAADLALGGATITPQRGDMIDVGEGEAKRSYEVLPRGNDDRVYRFTDQTRLQYRVFTIEKPPSTET